MYINLPTLLTLFRLLFSPIVLPLLIVYLSPYNVLWINGALAGLFILFSMTDVLDGYLARTWGEVTLVGKVLDPIADKFLVYATLVALLAVQKVSFVWVLLLIGREFFVMGLRLLALEHNISISVSFLGKIKTLVQAAYLTVAIANPFHDFALHASRTNKVEAVLLGATLIVSLWSAYLYYRAFVRALNTAKS